MIRRSLATRTVALCRYQVFVPESLAVHAFDNVTHLVVGVARSVVVPTGKLVDVAVKVVGAHVVVGSDVSALQHGPERFHAVRVGLPVDGLLDRLMRAGNPLVCRQVVRVDRRVLLRVGFYEIL